MSRLPSLTLLFRFWSGVQQGIQRSEMVGILYNYIKYSVPLIPILTIQYEGPSITCISCRSLGFFFVGFRGICRRIFFTRQHHRLCTAGSREADTTFHPISPGVRNTNLKCRFIFANFFSGVLFRLRRNEQYLASPLPAAAGAPMLGNVRARLV